MPKYPWMQFYVEDYTGDASLGLCRAATRGIWMDALCYMHKKDQSGQVSGSVTALAQICRCSASEMRVAIDELRTTEAADVSDCNGIITLTNRRMRRDFLARKSNVDRQIKHRLKYSNGESNGSVTHELTAVSPLIVQSTEVPPIKVNGKGDKFYVGEIEKKIDKTKRQIDAVDNSANGGRYKDPDGNLRPESVKYRADLVSVKHEYEDMIIGVIRPPKPTKGYG